MKKRFLNLVQKIESVLPMTLNSFLLFIFIIYLFFIVGRSIYSNYHANLDIEKQRETVTVMRGEIKDLQNQINYYQTKSYKEKEAREKLAYKAPGESVVAVSLDKKEDKVPDGTVSDTEIKVPNYSLWWRYFFGE